MLFKYMWFFNIWSLFSSTRDPLILGKNCGIRNLVYFNTAVALQVIKVAYSQTMWSRIHDTTFSTDLSHNVIIIVVVFFLAGLIMWGYSGSVNILNHLQITVRASNFMSGKALYANDPIKLKSFVYFKVMWLRRYFCFALVSLCSNYCYEFFGH